MIKRLDEYFSQTLTGSSFNSSNGVFKVNYHPYRDLSISNDIIMDPSRNVKDSEYRVGDFVKAKVKGLKNKIIGEVIGTRISEDGKYNLLMIKSVKTQKVHSAIPGTVEFNRGTGNIKSGMTANITAGERVAQSAKYSGGKIVWGSMESKDIDDELMEDESGRILGPMGTGYSIKLEDDPNYQTEIKDDHCIHMSKPSDASVLKDLIKATEIEIFFYNHPELTDQESIIKDLLSIFTLHNKSESGAYRILIQKFPEKNKISYGEAKDTYGEKVYNMLNSFK